MKSMRLYAALAQAVSVTTPVALTIWEESGNRRYSLSRYWKMMMKLTTFLELMTVDPLMFGITSQIKT